MSRFFDDLDRLDREDHVALVTAAEQERHLRLLADLGQDLAASADLDEMAGVLLVRLVEIVHADRGLLILADEGGRLVRIFKGIDGLGEPLLNEDLHHDTGVIQELMAGEEPVLRVPKDDAPDGGSVIAVPLAGSHGRFGALYVDRSGSDRPLGHGDLLMVRLVAAQAAPAFELHRHEGERRRADRVRVENEFLRRLSRRQVEQAKLVDELNRDLVRTSTFLEGVLESSTEYAIVATDRDGTITTFNTGASRLYGWAREEVEGRRRLDLLFDQGGPAEELFAQMVADASGAAGRFSGEALRRRRDGTQVPVQAALTAIRNPAGEITGYLDVSRDLTAERQMRHRLLVSEKLASLGTLAAGVAHEFNNLLQGIIGFLSHALEQDDAELRERAMRVSLDAGMRAALLVGRLQAFARPSVGGLAPVSLPELVDETLALVERSFRSEGIELERRCEDDLPPALADRSRMSQVLLNLLTNARHAVRESAVKRVTVSVAVEGKDRLRIDVSDTGCGIPEEMQSRIFEPFFTTKGALGGNVFDGKVHGTGLGLAISSGIVTEHGGSLDVESRSGEGSRFSVVLRQASAEALSSGAPPARAAPREQRGRSLSVLVVDDETVIRSWLCDLLRGRGHRVVTARDGRDGLARLAKGTFDVVVADWQMPGVDGGRFFRELTSRSQNGRLPRRILITGHLQGGELPAHVDLCLKKPCGAADLLAAVEAAARDMD